MTTLVPPSPYVPNYAYATGINDSGQVVGSYQDFSSYTHGFLYSGGTYTDLTPSGQQLFPSSINNAGQIVGDGGANGSFLYSSGTFGSIWPFPAPYGGWNYASVINNSGAVVGECSDTSQNRRAYIYSAGVATILPLLPGST